MHGDAPRSNVKALLLAFVVSTISSALSAFLLQRLNWITHSQLYGFGLQFDPLWAVPYWDAERLIYVCLLVTPLLILTVLVYDYLNTHRKNGPRTKLEDVASATALTTTSAGTVLAGSSDLITCPKCENVFGKLQKVHDFSWHDGQLVSACPYCGHVFGSAEADDSDSTRIMLRAR